MTIGDGPLSGLDDVEWDRLYHAYGPAIDVPDQLRALRSSDPELRAKANSHLWGNVYHQGTRWQASHAVVPFLVALVDDVTTPDRADVISLPAAIAIGDHRDDQLPFDAAVAFPILAWPAADLDEVLRRFYDDEIEVDEDATTDDEMALIEHESVRWEADCYHRGRLPTRDQWLGV